MPLWSILYVGVVCTQSIVFIYIHEPNPSTSTFCTEINLIQFQISIHTLVLYLNEVLLFLLLLFVRFNPCFFCFSFFCYSSKLFITNYFFNSL